MDDDPELRALGAELERDDPTLAALLSGTRRPHSRHPVAWTLALLVPGLGLLAAALLLPITVVLGVVLMLLILGSPFGAAWLCRTADEVRPRRPA